MSRRTSLWTTDTARSVEWIGGLLFGKSYSELTGELSGDHIFYDLGQKCKTIDESEWIKSSGSTDDLLGRRSRELASVNAAENRSAAMSYRQLVHQLHFSQTKSVPSQDRNVLHGVLMLLADECHPLATSKNTIIIIVITIIIKVRLRTGISTITVKKLWTILHSLTS